MIRVAWGEMLDEAPESPAKAKNWGTTAALLVTPFVEVHRIEVEPLACCSLHHHERKWNAFLVISGELQIETDDLLIRLAPGGWYAVAPGTRHRFVAGIEPVHAVEFYYPAELSEDIVRHGWGGRYAEDMSG